MTVFADPLARIFHDHDHSISEFHEIIIGSSQKQRLLIVCFTDRGETVRIFGARKATKRERQDYEENPSLINANAEPRTRCGSNTASTMRRRNRTGLCLA
ncbi:MAG: hypothetical protein OJF50_005144 [Nitrospira sp.]|nr:hypothetical protein [Nitrospira sp.]